MISSKLMTDKITITSADLQEMAELLESQINRYLVQKKFNDLHIDALKWSEKKMPLVGLLERTKKNQDRIENEIDFLRKIQKELMI